MWLRHVGRTDIDVDALVLATANFTPADIAHVARAVAQAAFERTIDLGSRYHPTLDDYMRAVHSTRPTLCPNDVARFTSDVRAFART